MSGGGDTTVNNGVPEWVRPYAESYMARAQQVSDLPYTPYDGQNVAQMNPYETAALQGTAQRAAQGSGVNQAAGDELLRTLSGQYLGQGNPYLQNAIDKTSGDIIKNYNSAVIPQMDAMDARSGSFGNSGIQSMRAQNAQSLQQTLADASSSMRYQDYGNERNRMGQAVSQSPTIANQDYVDMNALQGVGQAYRNQEQSNLTDQRARFDEANNYPRTQLGVMGQGLGLNFGNQSSTNSSSNPYATAAGLGATYLGASSMYGSSNNNASTAGNAGGGGK